MTTLNSQSGLEVLLNPLCRLLPSMATSAAQLESCGQTQASVFFFVLQFFAVVVVLVAYSHLSQHAHPSYVWLYLGVAVWAVVSVGLWYGLRSLGRLVGRRKFDAVQTSVQSLVKGGGMTEAQARQLMAQQEMVGGLQDSMLMMAGAGMYGSRR
jgi:S-adenosylmethionine/arginine decarboxylase-like enzyme